jgi:hypothetical protein
MIRFGWLAVFADGAPPNRLEVRINGPFRYRDANGPDQRLDAEKDWMDLVPLLALRADTIERAHVSTASDLMIDFKSGRRLHAAPYDGYEGWELKGPGFFIVGASDEPAIWTGDAWK